jgi:hypothetical protein
MFVTVVLSLCTPGFRFCDDWRIRQQLLEFTDSTSLSSKSSVMSNLDSLFVGSDCCVCILVSWLITAVVVRMLQANGTPVIPVVADLVTFYFPCCSASPVSLWGYLGTCTFFIIWWSPEVMLGAVLTLDVQKSVCRGWTDTGKAIIVSQDVCFECLVVAIGPSENGIGVVTRFSAVRSAKVMGPVRTGAAVWQFRSTCPVLWQSRHV